MRINLSTSHIVYEPHMRTRATRLLAAFSALATFGLAAYLAMDALSTPSPWRDRVVRVGYSSEPPYAFRRPDGKVAGESPTVARAVLTRMGIQNVRWVLMDFGALIPALESGAIDLIATGMFVTPEREQRIDFSLPTSAVGQGLLVRTGNPRRLHSYEDVAGNPEVVAAVLTGAVEQAYLERLGTPGRRLLLVPDAGTGLAAVRFGRADCLALSAPTVRYLALESGSGLEAAAPFTDPAIPGTAIPSLCAMGFRKDDRRFRAAFNKDLAAYLGSPEHLAAVQPFGFGPNTIPHAP